MSISIQNLTKLYNEQKALDNVSLEINKGEIVGLLGPNGAGKSTMMKIITCFIPPTKGSVKVCGYDIFDNPMDVRKKIGYLPEHNPLYLDMYVREYLDFVANFYQLDNRKARIEQMIERTGLTAECYKRIGQLSKGYRQRVGLAQALIHDPQVLILDEPTTGLHNDDVKRLLNVLHRIVDNGDTIIVIEHNLDVIKSADYIIDLGPDGGDAGGEIVTVGTPEKVAKNVKSYTGQYLVKVLK